MAPGERVTPPEHPKSDSDRSPAQGRASFVCPHCNAFAQQEWSELMVEDEEDQQTGFTNVREPVDFYTVGIWRHARCVACMRSSIWIDGRMVYPNVSTLPVAHEDMPEEVKALYGEAREVAAVSRRAGAAMARATLELLLKTVLPSLTTVPPKSSLDDLIALTEPMVSIAMETPLMVVRHAGNKSVHVEENPDDVMLLVLDESDTEVMELIFETINDLVSELIARKKKMAKYEALIPDGVKRAAERKRAKRAEAADE